MPCDLTSMNPIMAQVRRLQNMLRRRGQRREDAEDLVQEAFLRLQIYCNEGKEVRLPEAFLARTALNLAANAREADRSHLYTSDVLEDLQIMDLSPTPDEVLAAEECLSQIQALLRSLSQRTRDIFFMHRLHGMSYAQIADHFDISISAIEKHIATAMAALGPHMHEELRRK
jgi:RNA polymerase sigma factor (sigma-70 family)